jgi:hypothetical protein
VIALEAAAPRDAGLVVRTAAAVAAVALFYTSLDLYAADAWSAPPASLWIYAFVALGGALVLFKPDRLLSLLRVPFLVWLIGFFWLTTLWAIFLKDVPEISDSLAVRYRSMAFLLAFLVLMREPPVRRAALVAVAGGVVFAALLNVGEAAGLLRFAANEARVSGRAAGLYVNANSSGLAITAGLAVSTAALPRRWRAPLLLVGAVGVAFTFSRSSVVAFGVLLLALTWLRVVRIGPLAATAVLAVGTLLCFSEDLRRQLELAGVLNENTLSRLQLSRDDSGRIDVARRTWALFTDAPLFGNGIGATADWDVGIQPHNQYLFFAAEHGILGLLVLPTAALALVMGGRAAVPYAAVLLLAGLFNHALLFERPILVLMALAGAGGAPPTPEQGDDEDEREAEDA